MKQNMYINQLNICTGHAHCDKSKTANIMRKKKQNCTPINETSFICKKANSKYAY